MSHNCRRHLRWIRPAVLGFATLASLANSANSAERLGPVQPIVEPDFVAEIRKTLKQKERSGELAKLQREATDRAKRHVEEPPPVANVTRTTKARTFYLDPSYTQATAVYDHKGKMIVAAGTRVNPLEYITLSTRMLFFDGRDPDQVKKAMVLIKQAKQGIKPVLVGGKPFEMSRREKLRFYFDQGGELVRRFGIVHVPAMVSQDGYRIRVDELEIKS